MTEENYTDRKKEKINVFGIFPTSAVEITTSHIRAHTMYVRAYLLLSSFHEQTNILQFLFNLLLLPPSSSHFVVCCPRAPAALHKHVQCTKNVFRITHVHVARSFFYCFSPVLFMFKNVVYYVFDALIGRPANYKYPFFHSGCTDSYRTREGGE